MRRHKRPVNIYREVNHALALYDDIGEVCRLVPVAWPVNEVVHSLKVQIDEPLGVVERYLLECIARFGPIEMAGLKDLLGLDVAVIEELIVKLARYGEVTQGDAAGYVASPGVLNNLEQENWSYLADRKEAFLVDALSNRLLPIELAQLSDGNWLKVDMGSGLVTDHSGEVLEKICWMSGGTVLGMRHIEQLIHDGNQQDASRLGLPEGTKGVLEVESRLCRQRWLLAMIKVQSNGSISVNPTGSPATDLLCVASEDRETFQSAIRRGDGVAYGVLNADSEARLDKDIGRTWKQHINYSLSDDGFCVSFPDPKSIPLWIASGDDSGAQAAATAGGNKEAEFPFSLWQILRTPYWWHPFNFSVRRVLPDDKAAAVVLLLLRGMRALEALAVRYDDEDINLAKWWEGFQERTSREWPENVSQVRVPFKRMKAEASKSPDTMVVELVMESA